MSTSRLSLLVLNTSWYTYHEPSSSSKITSALLRKECPPTAEWRRIKKSVVSCHRVSKTNYRGLSTWQRRWKKKKKKQIPQRWI